jgi:hypothetical protein
MMSKEVSEYIENAPIEQKEIMKRLREIIFHAVPEVIEELKWNRPVYKYRKDIAYILVNKSHVNFGFSKFEKIKNPTALLEGNGKTMRHVKIRSLSDINDSLFKEWLRDQIAEEN